MPRPDGKPDNLGLLVLDEPSTKQSDPTVLALWLTENSKQHNVTVSRHLPRAGRGTNVAFYSSFCLCNCSVAAQVVTWL